jgi:hypothetical protein
MQFIMEELQKFGASLATIEAYIAAHPELFDVLAKLVQKDHPLAAIILHQIAVYLGMPK